MLHITLESFAGSTAPELHNQQLATYLENIQETYPEGRFYAEEGRDTGRDGGNKIVITVAVGEDNDPESGIVEEEEFFYRTKRQLEEDMRNLSFYIELS